MSTLVDTAQSAEAVNIETGRSELAVRCFERAYICDRRTVADSTVKAHPGFQGVSERVGWKALCVVAGEISGMNLADLPANALAHYGADHAIEIGRPAFKLSHSRRGISQLAISGNRCAPIARTRYSRLSLHLARIAFPGFGRCGPGHVTFLYFVVLRLVIVLRLDPAACAAGRLPAMRPDRRDP